MRMDILAALPLLQIHITAVFATLIAVVVADTHGLLWMLGKIKTLPKKRMELLHQTVWVGLFCIVAAGISMFLGYPEYLLSLPAFQFKALFVVFLLLNAFYIGGHLTIATQKSFPELTIKQKATLLISGAVSTIGWIGAYTCAQFLS